MLPADLADHITRKVEDWREATHEKGELKWVKVSKKKYRMYRNFAIATLARIRSLEMSFKSTIITQNDIDFKRFHNNDEELGLAKLTYQFLYHSFLKSMYAGDRVEIFLDPRPKPWSLNELCSCLNSKCKDEHGWTPVNSVATVDSKLSTIMQMNDILLGAVGFHANSRHTLPTSRQPKKDLAALIANEMELTDLCGPTSRDMANFGIWRFKFKTKKAP